MSELKEGSYITVGKITNGSPLNAVGLEIGNVYFDVSKIKTAIEVHGDQMPSDTIKRIPEILNSPIVITEYMPGQNTNSISVFGNITIEDNSPIVVGIVISKGRGGNVITKIRTVHPRGNVSLINDTSLLWLSENKNETRKWFQARGIPVPLGGKTFGLIRRISYVAKEVKTNSYKIANDSENGRDQLIEQEAKKLFGTTDNYRNAVQNGAGLQ